MTVLADFNIIIPEDHQGIGVGRDEQSPVGPSFNTGGRLGEGEGQTGALAAFIMFSVLNLQTRLDVFVNGEGPIGTMEPNPTPAWYSQVICMSGGRLNGGDDLSNQISVGVPPESAVRSTTFEIKNLICFYHQDSD